MKMKKMICILLAVLLLSGCGAAPAQNAAPAETAAPEQTTATEPQSVSTAVTFTDDLGREVTVDNPQRVVTLIGSFAHIWHLAGGADRIVATANDTWTSFDIPMADDVLNLGGTKDISLEAVISVEPDLVIASVNTEADLALQKPLEDMQIPTAYFLVSTFEEYLHMLDICCQILGTPENYQKNGADVQQQVDDARTVADGSAPTALYVRVSSSGCKVKNSQNSVLGEMLADLGAVNIADSETSLLENLSMEVILQQDPRFIFVILQSSDPSVAMGVLEETLLADPAWNSLTAVQEGRYYILDQTLYNLKPNDRWGIAYENLAQILYPAA